VNPRPPVTKIRFILRSIIVFRPAEVLSSENLTPLVGRDENLGLEVVIDHDPDEPLEQDVRLPTAALKLWKHPIGETPRSIILSEQRSNVTGF